MTQRAHLQTSEPSEARRQKHIAGLLAADVPLNFERFVTTYQDRIYAFAVSLTKNRSAAQEIAQDAFVRAYNALLTYDAQRIRSLSLRAWMYQITLNLTRNSRRRKTFETVALDDAKHIASGRRVDHDVEQAELAGVVRDAVEQLPAAFRVAVVLRHLDDLSYDEIAVITAQPVGTIKSNVHRGLAMLRKELHHVNP